MRNVSVTVRTTIKADRGADAMLRRLQRLTDSDGAFVLELLQQVVRETLIAAYRKRFNAAKPRMLNMQREQRGPAFHRKLELGERSRQIEKEMEGVDPNSDRFRKLSARIDELTAEFIGGPHLGHEGVTNIVGGSGAAVHAAMVHGLNLHKPSGPGSLSTGLFTPRMNQVLEELEKVTVLERTMHQMTLGIGDLAVLESKNMETPSFTEHGLNGPGHETDSSFRILWRQLEFGTGIYAKPSPRPGPTTWKESTGSWWYGQLRGNGLHLRGSRPGNILWDAQSVPYSEDASGFESRFAGMLQRAILGL